MDYKLDTTEARKADNAGGFITHLGKYIGTFTQAVAIEAKTGTHGVSFAFKSIDGQKANLTIYTVKADGEKIGGYAALMAIMACLSLRGLAQSNGVATQYDRTQKKDIQVNAKIYPELANKKIGVLLETEEYEKTDGSIGAKMVLKGVFHAESELTASEILDKKTVPEQLAKNVASLRHRALKTQTARPASAPQRQASQQSGGSNGFDSMEDDIPYANPLRGAARCLAL
jgi:hypothetical protein